MIYVAGAALAGLFAVAGNSAIAQAYPAKLVRDGIIWSHLAGDATQRLKVVRRLPG